MADIFPFRATIYNQKKIKDLSKTVAPPYDIISKKEQKQLYRAHPNNIVRLILEKDKNYKKASGDFKKWLKERILVEDEKPSIYVYLQEFTAGSKKLKRLGFLALMKIDEAKKKKILPHENVLLKPLEDRLRLLKSVKANLSPIFSVFGDENKEVTNILGSFTRKKKPFINIHFGGVKHLVWKLDDEKLQKKILKSMSRKKVFIADGHHRYQAATLYRDHMRKKLGKATGKERFDYLISYFVSAEDKGLITFPTHRAIVRIPDFNKDKVLSILSAHFRISLLDSKKALLENMRRLAKESGVFGLYMGDKRYYLLRIKDIKILAKQMPGESKERRALDVVILHSFILKKLLKMEQGFENKENFIFSHKDDYILRLVDGKKAQAAFLLNPTKIEDVKKVAFSNQKMPQKSTYFYPKVLSGVVINNHHTG